MITPTQKVVCSGKLALQIKCLVWHYMKRKMLGPYLLNKSVCGGSINFEIYVLGRSSINKKIKVCISSKLSQTPTPPLKVYTKI